jgi:heme/copper-type cytochrome/quinol oxidase subunit 3
VDRAVAAAGVQLRAHPGRDERVPELEQLQTSFVDARRTQRVGMPYSSPWPIVFAFIMSAFFAVLVIQKYGVAAICAVLLGLVLVGWHSEEAPTRGAPLDGRPASWWGMAMVIAAEATLFAMMIGSYFILRFKNIAWPPRGIPEPKLVVPLVMLGVLLLSLVPVQLAFRAARDGLLMRARTLLVGALIVQAGYFAMQVHLFSNDLRTFAPQTHAYGSIYYTLLGASHAHVALGLLFDVWLLWKLSRGLTQYRLNGFQAIALYWLAVGAITTVVTLTTLSPAL